MALVDLPIPLRRTTAQDPTSDRQGAPLSVFAGSLVAADIRARDRAVLLTLRSARDERRFVLPELDSETAQAILTKDNLLAVALVHPPEAAAPRPVAVADLDADRKIEFLAAGVQATRRLIGAPPRRGWARFLLSWALRTATVGAFAALMLSASGRPPLDAWPLALLIAMSAAVYGVLDGAVKRWIWSRRTARAAKSFWWEIGRALSFARTHRDAYRAAPRLSLPEPSAIDAGRTAA